jgi:lipopolysaccharide/colanic/teichoic acid biosynthesis glycosyltransferase
MEAHAAIRRFGTDRSMTPAKRAFDIALATTLLLLLAPLMLLLATLMLIRQGRPVFYVSERMAAPGRAFALVKLRTMTTVPEGVDRGVSGADKTARITSMGRHLRRLRLDEIPQLWNILRGDMSFVGPRPPLRDYVERFPDLYAQVLACRPGITGLATLVYHAHEERLLARSGSAEETDLIYSRICVPRKASLDLIYRRHRSVCFDMALLGRTVLRVWQRPVRSRRRNI